MRKLILAAMALCACPALALATPILSSSAGTFATAQNLNGFFSLNALANVFDSTTIPHVEISQNGRPGTGFDYYAFSHNGGTVHLDIDDPSAGSFFDTQIGIWTAAGVLVGANDDAFPLDPGDSSGLNSRLQGMNLASGDYVVGVCRFPCGFGANGVITGNPILTGGGYTLNVSANSVPEPATLGLIGIGLAGLGRRLRRRKV